MHCCQCCTQARDGATRQVAAAPMNHIATCQVHARLVAGTEGARQSRQSCGVSRQRHDNSHQRQGVRTGAEEGPVAANCSGCSTKTLPNMSEEEATNLLAEHVLAPRAT